MYGDDDIDQSEDKSMSAIRTGINIRDDFWDDVLQLINNSENLSVLLDVPNEKIITWRERIKHALAKVQDADKSEDVHKKNKMIKTGLPE